MKTYTSGRPRVHASFSVDEINAALVEYEQYISTHDGELASDLAECVFDLREELEIRRAQR